MPYILVQPPSGEGVLIDSYGAQLYWRVVLDELSPLFKYTADSYSNQILQLLPMGDAWDEARLGNLRLLTETMAQELARLNIDVDDLSMDWIPLFTVNLLSDWERCLALPDSCIAEEDQTQQQRRDAVVAKLTNLGYQTPAYYRELARTLGYTVEIIEHFPFRADEGTAEAPANSEEWAYTWEVRQIGFELQIRDFRVGTSAVGERLRQWGNTQLECIIRDQAPAHTQVLFSYGV